MGLAIPALRESDEEIARSALPDDISLETLKAEGWKKTFPARPDFTNGTLRVSGFTDGDAPRRDDRLQLLTPKAHYFLNSSYVNLARQRRGMDRPTLDMNVSDAAARNLSDGDRVTIRNAQGSVTAWLRVGDSVRPGVVSLTGKWWSHPPETSAVTNVLTPSAWAPGGQPAYNDTFVEVVAAPLPSLAPHERATEALPA
jgi:anaerobic selenocysteine-containing dehydrogenase